MLVYNIAVLVFLPILVFGQVHFDPLRCNHAGPPYHHQHVVPTSVRLPPNAATTTLMNRPLPLHNHKTTQQHNKNNNGLRHGRRMAPEPIGEDLKPKDCAAGPGVNFDPTTTTTTAAPPPMPRIDCGEPPIKRQEQGCPCFSLKVLQDMNLGAHEYCDYYATPVPDDDDPCKDLYPPTYVYVSASSYGSGGESSYVSFDVSRHWDPEMEGGTCYASVSMSTDSDPDNYLDYDTESHYFSIYADLSEQELVDCEKNMNDIKTDLEKTDCYITIGGF